MDLTHKHWRETMAVVALIPSVEEFLLAGLISLAIVFATIRAYCAKLLASMEAAGFSPLFIISLLSVLSVYGCVVVVQCCAWCQHVGHDDECGTTEEVVPNSRFKSSFFFWIGGGMEGVCGFIKEGGVLLNPQRTGSGDFEGTSVNTVAKTNIIAMAFGFCFFFLWPTLTLYAAPCRSGDRRPFN